EERLRLMQWTAKQHRQLIAQVKVPVEDKATTFREEPPDTRPSKTIPQPPPDADTVDPTTGYGPVRPVRRRILHKDGASALYRPGRMMQDDFQDMMQEIVPQLIKQVIDTTPPASSASEPVEPSSTVESQRGQKRMVDDTSGAEQPVGKRAAAYDHTHDMDDSLIVEPVGSTFAKDEVAICSVEVLQQQSYDPRSDNLSLEDLNQLISMYREGTPHEILVATYLKKKAAKELPVSGNPTEIQIKIDEAKLLEWNTILAKHAARLVLGPEAEGVRRHHSDRIMGSRYVITVKQEDDSAPRMKARWKCGAWDAIMHRVRDAEDLALDEAWSPSLSGSMSDGSKRLREDRAPSTPVTYGSGYTTADPPMPSEKNLIASPSPGGELPHGVSTITQWGKTVVSFGKYKGSKSYAEMFESTSEDLASYRSYCQSHYQSGSPALRDLVDYFRTLRPERVKGRVGRGDRVGRGFRQLGRAGLHEYLFRVAATVQDQQVSGHGGSKDFHNFRKLAPGNHACPDLSVVQRCLSRCITK
ncbi:Putative transposon protein, partial [Durusdinium trenchii]